MNLKNIYISLGMDSTSFRRRRAADESDDKALGQESEAEKYADCEKFCFKCPHEECKKEIRFESFFTGKVGKNHVKLGSEFTTSDVSRMRRLLSR